MIYLDHAATTPLDPAVAHAMAETEALSFANPNSLHPAGQQAAGQLRQAKATLADCLGVSDPADLILTSGGTEANNLAILGGARARRGQGRHLITTAIEHAAVLAPMRYLAEQEGFTLTVVPVDDQGRVDPAQVLQALRPDTILVSVMHANNETGALQPIEAIGQTLRERGVAFHVDAVQTVGKLPLDLKTLPVDFLSCSAHKLYGPKGVGFLYCHPDATPPWPLQLGGSQEGGLRAGTTPVALAVGLAKAVELAMADLPQRTTRLEGMTYWLIQALESTLPPSWILNTPVDPSHRLPGIVNGSLPPIAGDRWVLQLGMRGVAIASGSACHAGQIDPSHVLLAMGRTDEEAKSSMRWSLGRHTTQEELSQALDCLQTIVIANLLKLGTLQRESC